MIVWIILIALFLFVFDRCSKKKVSKKTTEKISNTRINSLSELLTTSFMREISNVFEDLMQVYQGGELLIFKHTPDEGNAGFDCLQLAMFFNNNSDDNLHEMKYRLFKLEITMALEQANSPKEARKIVLNDWYEPKSSMFNLLSFYPFDESSGRPMAWEDVNADNGGKTGFFIADSVEINSITLDRDGNTVCANDTRKISDNLIEEGIKRIASRYSNITLIESDLTFFKFKVSSQYD